MNWQSGVVRFYYGVRYLQNDQNVLRLWLSATLRNYILVSFQQIASLLIIRRSFWTCWQIFANLTQPKVYSKFWFWTSSFDFFIVLGYFFFKFKIGLKFVYTQRSTWWYLLTFLANNMGRKSHKEHDTFLGNCPPTPPLSQHFAPSGK